MLKPYSLRGRDERNKSPAGKYQMNSSSMWLCYNTLGLSYNLGSEKYKYNKKKNSLLKCYSGQADPNFLSKILSYNR